MIATSTQSIKQQTLKEPFSLKGIGLHSGKKVNLTIEPANNNNGIKFIRTDLLNNNKIDALWSNVSSTNLCTTISNEKGISVSTVEHLMSALSGMHIDNVNILIDGVPIIGRKSGQINLDQIDLSNIDKIEILKGPASVNYGTNSTGGIINLITKKKEDQVKINFYKESIGIEKCNINLNKNNNTNYLNLNFGGYKFAGIDNDQSTRKKDWNYKKQKII